MPEQPPKGRIIVFGILFWYPLAGVTYQFLHYLLALRRLGYDPYYVEDSGRWVYDPVRDEVTADPTGNIEAVLPILQAHGFGERWAFRGAYPGGRCFGMTEDRLLRLYREADAFLNITGAQEIRPEHLECRRRIYVETDPVVSQIRVAAGDEDMIGVLDMHDTHFSFGENLGATDCGVPVGRFRWLPTRQPIVLDLWAQDPGTPGRGYTTIASWRNKGRDIVYRGETYYWSKDREFLRFIDLPRRRAVAFEPAMRVNGPDRAMLEHHGWRLLDPVEKSGTIDSYREFIRSSRAEFTVAKDQNVRLRSGWFSDRSASYLASGRPVITQNTGFRGILPCGKGLFGFCTLEEAEAAVDEIEMDYAAHSRAAAEISRDYFDGAKVVGSLLSRAGL
jgi:hypothetical protein